MGPLPSAVYWRRRAVVLGGLVLLAFIPYAACSAGEPDKPTATSDSTRTEEPGIGGDLGSADPGAVAPSTSGNAAGTPGPAGAGTGKPTPAVAPVPGGAPAAPTLTAPSCTDTDLALTPVPDRAGAPAGTALSIRLVVQNAATHSCARDLGADAQELRIVRGAETMWSSDHCATGRNLPNVRTIRAGERLEYMVTWNGRSSTQGQKCGSGVPIGAMPAGSYEVIARVGTKLSAPVALRVG
ncbi:hypothetical protein [Pilimelia anulata]|uniref:hypothetical protein n=1 Tax=Pilimelia anulata TaxID=53371 RepID=UPI001666D180|nr:hypothetical protein [Pilimelia anulata]